MRGSATFIVALTLLCATFTTAIASTRYPRIARDAQGTWVPADEALIYVTGNLWTFYGAGIELN